MSIGTVHSRAPIGTAIRYMAAGEFLRAKELLVSALAQLPGDPQLTRLLGRASLLAGDAMLARQSLARAIAAGIATADVHFELGEAALRCGDPAAAEGAWRAALRIHPGFDNAQAALGELFVRRGEHLDQAAALLQSVVDRQPAHPLALDALCALHNVAGVPSRSVSLLERALQHRPEDTTIRHNLAIALQSQGRLKAAASQYRAVLERRPTWQRARSNYLFLLHSVLDDPAELFSEHRKVSPRVEPMPPPDRVFGAGRLRIGFLSGGFCDHPIAYFIEPIFQHLDRGRFDVFAYSDDERRDSARERLMARVGAGAWRDVAALDDAKLASQIRADGIDVLFELAAHSDGGKRIAMLASKPAPVQITYLGYAGTTGLSAVDYRLTDHLIDPIGQSEAFHSERLLRMPTVHWAYRPPSECPDVSELPAKRNGYVTFGSANRLDKISDDVAAQWARVVASVPESRLRLMARGLEDAETRARLIGVLGAYGVDSRRVEFSGLRPSGEYFKRIGEIDIALDTFPFAGGTSTCHSLWMGVPVVSRFGRTSVSRVGLSILSAVGLRDLATDDPDQFVEITTRLAGDLPGLAELRGSLRNRVAGSAMCDEPGFVRHLEAMLSDLAVTV